MWSKVLGYVRVYDNIYYLSGCLVVLQLEKKIIYAGKGLKIGSWKIKVASTIYVFEVYFSLIQKGMLK